MSDTTVTKKIEQAESSVNDAIQFLSQVDGRKVRPEKGTLDQVSEALSTAHHGLKTARKAYTDRKG